VDIGGWEVAEHLALWIEFAAVVIIAIDVVLAIAMAIRTQVIHGSGAAFDIFKKTMARGLLVGLDLLIAADIIKTVTLEPTLDNVLVLAILVLVRTFLSWSLVVEIEGRWPWEVRSPRHEEAVRPTDR
jgi:uncharacterized membrane protein